MMPLIVRRYGPPHKEDQLPKGTICIVDSKLQPIEIWEQQAEDGESPKWILRADEEAKKYLIL